MKKSMRSNDPFWQLLWYLPLHQTVMAADPIIIKFSHVVADDTPKGEAAELFQETCRGERQMVL
jgi:TRAP-type C4-dicarboxylate transport system substrate-binding protein